MIKYNPTKIKGKNKEQKKCEIVIKNFCVTKSCCRFLSQAKNRDNFTF